MFLLQLLVPIIILFPLPPPWVPVYPITQPMRIEYAGLDSLTVIPRPDGEVVAFTPRGPRRCYRIAAYDPVERIDENGKPFYQEYHYQDRAGCGFVTWVPLVEQSGGR